MKDNENVSFEELLSNLNNAINQNGGKKLDSNSENLDKTIEMKAVLPKGSDSDAVKERITNTFRKLKNPEVYSQEPTDSFAKQLKDVSEVIKKENEENGISPMKDILEQTAEFSIDESTKRITSSELKSAFEQTQEQDSSTIEKVKDIFAGVSKKARKNSEKIYTGDEYTSVEQNKKFLSAFGRDNNAVLIRMIGTMILSLILFYVDLVPVVNLKLLPSFLMPPEYNVVYILFQMQILFFIILINHRALGNGFLDLFSGSPSPDTVTLISCVAIIMHDIVTVLTCTKEATVCVYNSACALCFIMGLAYEFSNLRTRLSAFRISSGKTPKYVITPISRFSSEKEVFSDYADEENNDMFSVSRTKFVDRIMSKIHTNSKIESYLKFLLPVSVAISVIFFFMTVKNGGNVGYHAFTLCLLMCLPVSVYAASCQPLSRAQAILEKTGTAILGSTSVEKLASAGVMSFNDSDVFPSSGIKVNNILIYGDNRIDHVIYYAAGAFSKLGGPLRDVFASADADSLSTQGDIKIISVAKNGFTAVIDGKHITVGKATYLREKGFLTEATEEDSAYEARSGRIMYMAYDNRIAAKFYVKYTMDPEFAELLKKADSIGMYVGVRTFDPNIDDSLLAYTLNLKKYPVKVVKLSQGETLSSFTENEDCPAVSRGAKGGAKSLLSAMFLSNRIRTLRKLHLCLMAVALVAAVVIMASLVSADTFKFTYSLYPMLFQLLWTVIIAATNNILLQ